MIGGMSPEARALLRAAKSDAPPTAARAAIWNGVAQTALPPVPTVAPPLPVAVAAGVAAPAVTMKAAFVGAILGSVLSAGITLALLSPMHPRAAEPAIPLPSPVVTALVEPPVSAPEVPRGSVEVAPAAAAPLVPTPAKAAQKTRALAGQDSLSREVALVAQARGELLRGDGARALATIRLARALKVRQLEPEELSVEIRALRALGRTGEADRVDARLRAGFPEDALAR